MSNNTKPKPLEPPRDPVLLTANVLDDRLEQIAELLEDLIHAVRESARAIERVVEATRYDQR